MPSLDLQRFTRVLLLSFIAVHHSDTNALAAIKSSNQPVFDGITFRRGTPSDEPQIALTMARNLMNPLEINSKRFIVAVKEDSPKQKQFNNNDIEEQPQQLLGWAQLRPMGPSIIDPQTYNSRPGSGSMEREIDDELWDEFETDALEFPNGFASLPWTQEYKAYAEASIQKRERRRLQLEERARSDVQRDRNQLWELASVYVVPKWRQRSIGSELVRRTLARHELLERNSNDVYLLTSLGRTQEWYQKFGFEVTDEPPAAMSFEVAVGGLIAKILGEELISMRGGN